MTPLEQAFTDLAYAITVPPKWVINDWVPVGLSLMAGPPKKSYKSTLTIIKACLAARWSTQALPAWAYCDLGGPTLMFSYEADAGEVLWVVKEGLKVQPEPGAIWIATDPWEFQLDVPEQANAILDYLNDHSPRLIIMDPFRNMWSGDENDSGAIIQALGPLRRWAHDNEAAIIVVHHINKPPPESPGNVGSMYTMRGSSALPGLADGIIVIEPTRTEGQVTVHTTFKRGASWRRTFALGVPGYGWPSSGYEVLPELALAIREAWNTRRHGTRDLGFFTELVAGQKSTVGTIKLMTEALVRNSLIQITPQERAIFLGPSQGGSR